MRTAFIEQLVREAMLHENIFLLVGDLGYSVVEPFAQQFPDRYLNVGIAEQNMTGIAVGLAREGYNVFTYSIGNFPTLRCMEQIRYDVCYHEASVKVVAVGGGYAYGPLGVSHHTTEELGMMRTIPNLNVIAPADPLEARQITTMLCNTSVPAYLRLGKAGEPIVHQADKVIEWGKFIPVLSGMNTVVLSTGAMLKYCYDTILNSQSGFGLLSVPFIKPLDLATLAQLTREYDRIITIEEHQRSAGFGSAILEGLHDLYQQAVITKIPVVKRVAIPDLFIGVAGTQNYLRGLAGLII
ncbi:transketolase [Spirosoma sp. KCTC 42546]|uniref:transketolase family protein n=1 Tax=Spirosoma sp. KCTC 42546 TaxID=2520506 RepID=UPI00115ABF29|nr:transketolase C-terminal domain-containing protein [Spirosoma sp. KCTC 42546]QDK83090.1 transketolase [Spirosoma sp. KCTC 42546]